MHIIEKLTTIGAPCPKIKTQPKQQNHPAPRLCHPSPMTALPAVTSSARVAGFAVCVSRKEI